jgi:hypothetical protein
MRENRTYGSEGGEGGTLSLPLSVLVMLCRCEFIRILACADA